MVINHRWFVMVEPNEKKSKSDLPIVSLKISKKKKGTYCIESLSIKLLRELMQPRTTLRSWHMTKDESYLILQ